MTEEIEILENPEPSRGLALQVENVGGRITHLYVAVQTKLEEALDVKRGNGVTGYVRVEWDNAPASSFENYEGKTIYTGQRWKVRSGYTSRVDRRAITDLQARMFNEWALAKVVEKYGETLKPEVVRDAVLADAIRQSERLEESQLAERERLNRELTELTKAANAWELGQ